MLPCALEAAEQTYLSGRIGRRAFIRMAAAAGLAGIAIPALADELEAIRANQDARGRQIAAAYDYIIVGTGAAGCALAGRLASSSTAKILIIEAGGWDTAPSVADPRVWFTNLGTERDWGDVAIPTPHVNNRAIAEHMGKVVGGGTSINATIWARPFKQDLDHWAEVTGDEDWGYEHGLSLYRKIENWQGGEDARYRGKGGPVWCQPAASPLAMAPAVLEAARARGFTIFPDQNGAREESAGGFAMMNQIIKNGQRNNMAKAYLYPVLSKPNVTLLTATHVDRVIVQNGRAIGVEIATPSGPRKVLAREETILCAGGINSAKLLMLSGIGDERELAAVGIKSVVHSPDVGAHFQDHILHGGCLWEAPNAFELRNSGAEVAGFWKSRSDLDRPDINIVQIELPYASEVIAKNYAPPPTSWALCAGLVAPKSRGKMRLRSSNAADRPLLDANFLSHPDDVEALAAGIELARDLGNSAALKPFAKREVVPGRKLERNDMANFIKDGATTYFHEVGTCRMGKDGNAVVDPKLRVNGLTDLRVADASIMPRIPGVATMATCVLIGERMAEIISPKA